MFKTAKKQDFTLKMLFYILLGVVVVIILMLFSNGISGNDFWWHIKAGNWIAEHKSIPTTDIFSWIGKQYAIPWTAHEWLSELIFYGIYSAFGSIGIYIMSVLLAGCLTFLIIKQVEEYIFKNIFIGALFICLFAVLTSLFFYGRPHIFSFFMVFFELKILYGFLKNPESKKIYLLPVIACLWSNLHGGSSNLSYILCLLFAVVSTLNFEYGRVFTSRLDRKYLLKIWVVFALTIIGVMANPIGFKVLIYPYANLSDNLQMTLISEWQAPDAKKLGDLFMYFLPIVLMTVGFFTEKERIELIDIVIMGVFLLLFLRSSRFIILWYIAASFYAFKYLPPCKIKPIIKKSEKAFLYLCVFFTIAGSVYGAVKVGAAITSPDLITKVVSDDMISEIKKTNPKRIFNDYNTGETLIYNGIDVFFDARADLFAAEHLLEDGVSLLLLQQANPTAETDYTDVESIIKKYDFDSILVLKDRPLYSYLVSNPDEFPLLKEDDLMGFFLVNCK